MKKKSNLTTILLLGLVVVGLGLLGYPSFANWWNSFHQSRAVASYLEAVTDMNVEEYEAIIDAALEYNERLSETGIVWVVDEEQEKEYRKELDVDGSGIMGYIDIPKINVKLPVYHGIDEAVLQVAIGHLVGTSLPVGGPGSHCVVSGHRGLPSARLFTDLDKLTEGDAFTVTVLNYTVTYAVDQIRIVEPTNLSDLTIEPGEDYFTLVTCTPYGINTHRLLVRGHRIENAHGTAMVVADALQIEPMYIAPFIAVPVLLMLVILMFISTGQRKRRKKRQLAEKQRQLEEKQKTEKSPDQTDMVRTGRQSEKKTTQPAAEDTKKPGKQEAGKRIAENGDAPVKEALPKPVKGTDGQKPELSLPEETGETGQTPGQSRLKGLDEDEAKFYSDYLKSLGVSLTEDGTDSQ